MLFQNTLLAYLQTLQDTPPTPVATAQAVQPIDQPVPLEIVTAQAVGVGTLRCSFYELWNAPVWAMLPGLAGTTNLLDVLKAQLSLGAITMQKIIQAPTGFMRGYVYHGCFRGDTRFLTKEGTRTFAETVGTTQQVLSRRGEWTEGEIQSFGIQRLYKLVVARNGRQKEIYTTAEHRWFKSGSRKLNRSVKRLSTCAELTTADLQPGDCLWTTFRTNHLDKVRPSAIGIQAGIVYGDGHLEGRRGKSGTVRLYGEKDAQLLKWFPLSPTRTPEESREGAESCVQVCDLPQFFKAPPPLDESMSYLYGWLSGYFAADGNVQESGTALLRSRSLESIRVAQDVCHVLGIRTHGVVGRMERGIGGKLSMAYSLGINIRDVCDDFFLLDEHRVRAAGRRERTEKTLSDWMVISVEPTDKWEEVFCAVVPDGKAFTLEDNILTGNCVITDIDQGENINIGTMTIQRTLTVQYCYTTYI